MALPNVWHPFNLSESPFFPQTLRAGQDEYPITLFVGREQDATRFLRTFAGSPDTSRQTVHGPRRYDRLRGRHTQYGAAAAKLGSRAARRSRSRNPRSASRPRVGART